MFQRFTILLIFSLCTSLQAQTYRYLILFKDKASNVYSLNKPEAFLSSKSLERRTKNVIAITQQDLPVSETYLNQVRATGARILFPLKWINGALIAQKPSEIKKTLA